ncbi:MAG: fibronectin type III domain-containing protein [Bacteroidales bacterium]|nr:fibronectin type III domain-containing protein [Bacteroidales bacterium]
MEATATSATFTWKVDWIGNRISVVEVSEHMDMSDSHFFGSEEELNKEVFTVLVEDLKPGIKYYYRYWVWNQNYLNNKFVMEEKSFITATDMPSVKTLEVIDITRVSAIGQGEILSDGGLEITERGICWGTSHNPTISGSHAASDQNTSTFSVSINDLTAEETYYVRAYAVNANGTVYGDPEVWFITGDAVVPTVTTTQVTDISWRTAVGSGEVTDDGDAMVTERGFCWSTNSDPTIDDSYVSNGTGTGMFMAEMTGLTAGTTYHVRVYAKNRAGCGYGNIVSFRTNDAILPTVTTAAPADITRTTATCGGEVTSDGGEDITERGVCWSTNSTPTISGSHLADVENGMGGFSVQITGLASNTSYYVCSYAINSAGISYGMPKSFATLSIEKPTVATAQVTNISQTSATSGGEVTDDGGAEVIERGICWGMEQNPTIESNIGHMNSGTGTGPFTLNVTNLNSNTTYYVRAYAKNSEGTNYGNEQVFVTLATVATVQVTEIKMRTATCSGHVDSGGDATIIERGVCWSTSHNPTMSDSHAVCATAGVGDFTVNISNLAPDTRYYVKAYVINGSGTTFGNEISFSTESSWPNGTLPGAFTVNASGKKVYFSQGNLQYIGSASTPYWKFADDQWTFFGNNGQGSTSQIVDRDLFGWGTSGKNHGAVCYQPWSTSTNNADYYAYGNLNNGLNNGDGRADWGYNAISNGGNQTGMWRTLTEQELHYLALERENAYELNRVGVYLNGVYGAILLPDDWDFSIGPLHSLEEWLNVWEPAGAVFFPSAGARVGTIVTLTFDPGVNEDFPLANYWLASPYNQNSNYAYCFSFDGYYGIYISTYNSFRHRGFAVRLVRDVE